jgi:hypothetical protein
LRFLAGSTTPGERCRLADPVEDKIAVGREFYLAPLVPLVGRGGRAR